MSKIAFITGASSGIGAACARKFAQEGYTLLLNARSVDKLQALKTELETTYGTDILLLPFDVRDRKAAEEAITTLPEQYQSIDILVNNAGLALGMENSSRYSFPHLYILQVKYGPENPCFRAVKPSACPPSSAAPSVWISCPGLFGGQSLSESHQDLSYRYLPSVFQGVSTFWFFRCLFYRMSDTQFIPKHRNVKHQYRF